MTVIEAMGNDGDLPTVTWKGETYKVAFACPEVIAHMEREVLRFALAQEKSLRKEAEEMPEEAGFLNAQADAIKTIIASKLYGYQQPYYTEVSNRRDFQALQLFGCIRFSHPKFTLSDAMELVLSEPKQVENAMGVVDPSFFPFASRAMGVPVEVLAMIHAQSEMQKAAVKVKLEMMLKNSPAGLQVTQGSLETPTASVPAESGN